MNYFEYMAEYIKSGGKLFGEDGKINPSFLPNDTIDFDAHGVNISGLVLSGGGTETVDDPELAQRLFTEIAEKRPKYALMSTNVTQFRCTVATQADAMLGMFLVANLGSQLLTAKIVVMPKMSGSAGNYTGITIIAEVM